VNARNSLDGMIYSIEKTVKENGEKIPADEKTKVETALTAARPFITSDDLAAIEKATQDLTAASHAMAELLYKTAQPGAGAEAGTQSEQATTDGADAKKEGEEPIDADFKQV
jgi:molecular chaperone DnaK